MCALWNIVVQFAFFNSGIPFVMEVGHDRPPSEKSAL